MSEEIIVTIHPFPPGRGVSRYIIHKLRAWEREKGGEYRARNVNGVPETKSIS